MKLTTNKKCVTVKYIILKDIREADRRVRSPSRALYFKSRSFDGYKVPGFFVYRVIDFIVRNRVLSKMHSYVQIYVNSLDTKDKQGCLQKNMIL